MLLTILTLTSGPSRSEADAQISDAEIMTLLLGMRGESLIELRK